MNLPASLQLWYCARIAHVSTLTASFAILISGTFFVLDESDGHFFIIPSMYPSYLQEAPPLVTS